MIPHRQPFLMIDKVVDVVANARATGIKNVSINEHYFQGHFPARPVMPGVLIIEAMAQTAAVLVVHTLGPEAEGKLVYFMSVDNARFRRPVFPGDVLHVHVSKQRNRGNVWKFEGRAEVRGQLDGRSGVRRDDPRRLSRSAMAQVHPTAIVAPGAMLAEDVVIGPYCIVGRACRARRRRLACTRMSSIDGRTTIGERHPDLPVRLDRPRAAGSQIQGRALIAGDRAPQHDPRARDDQPRAPKAAGW